MKILIIKMSSMGDIIHALTALTAAAKAVSCLRADWVAEEAFVEIPAWHPQVDRVIPIALRRWGKAPWKTWSSGEWRRFYQQLRHESYDLVIDAQGLIKSSVITRLSRGRRVGLDKQSLWEPLSRFGYQRHCSVDPDQHAIIRVNKLFAQALHYSYSAEIDYGLDRQQFVQTKTHKPYLLFLHGTSWQTKLWPYGHWLALAKRAQEAGHDIYVSWGNAVEQQRATALAADCAAVTVLDRMGLTEMASVIANAKAVIAVDTGLGHLAAALSVPTLSLYGPTQWREVGARGNHQYHLSAPLNCRKRCSRHHCMNSRSYSSACLSAIMPTQVWSQLCAILD
ncbi:MAG: lipopolysaccharide heptosyltransferase I [Gammaproteobacteria bacterium]|nr:lipopolysaccharide heptosyltransferase I [Gammaproteobacteria bacterium]